jgi:hypothetical protein
MTPFQACMGGWCRKRDRCEYHTSPLRYAPAERLCERNRDGVMLVRTSQGATVRQYVLTDRSVLEAA